MNYALLLVLRDIEVFDPLTEEYVQYVKNDMKLMATYLGPGVLEWPADNPIGVLYVPPVELIQGLAVNLLSSKQIGKAILDYYKKR